MQKVRTILSKVPGGLFSILAVLLILWLTLAPDPLPEHDLPLFPGADKLAHLLMFGFLTACMLLDRTRRHAWRRIGTGFALFAALFSSLFGIGIEFAQTYMALGRSYETADMIADSGGAFLLMALWLAFQGKWSMRGDDDVAPSEPEAVNAETDTPETQPPQPGMNPKKGSDGRRKHWIKNAWVRRPLKVLFWTIIGLLLLPVLLYIPPVQTFVAGIACRMASEATGMQIGIERFRLRFPLDVALDGVTVIEAQGDTMVRARTAIADVRIMPLLDSEIVLKRLRLKDGYYRMLASDSSMLLKLRAGLLDVEPGASFSLRKMQLLLDKAQLDDADISLFMDVWKQTPSPQDTTSTKMLIRAKELRMSNFRFAMSMLPTIDTLDVSAGALQISDALVDLGNNVISARYAGIAEGDATFLSPTPEYVKTHPAPVDTTSSDSAPMTISIDSISLDRFKALYATAGVRPAKGFDPSYISVTDLSIGLKDFYNQSALLRLPITRLQARERSGLTITEGSGTIGLNAAGLTFDALRLRTAASLIQASATLPFAFMELKPDARIEALVNASVGQSDILAFMPDTRKYLDALPTKAPATLRLNASGSLSDMEVRELKADIPSTLSIYAKGKARNPLDLDKLQAALTFDGSLSNPAFVETVADIRDIHIPTLTITGEATADRRSYTADFNLETSAGDVVADGHVNLNSEVYGIDAEIDSFDVGAFLPDLGIGHLTASVDARGAGFNPTHRNASTDAKVLVRAIEYKGKSYHDITLGAILHDGDFRAELHSPNPDADLDVKASGRIDSGLYTFDVDGNVRHIDLLALGLSTEQSSGNADFHLTGTADPEAWLYNADLDVVSFDWNLPDRYIHLPAALTAAIRSTDNSVDVTLASDQTDLAFSAAAGIKSVIDSFTAVGEEAVRQIDARRISIEGLRSLMPQFSLHLNANGNGLLRQLLSPDGIAVDTLWADIRTDSILTGDIGLQGVTVSGLDIDTVSATLGERNGMLDYRVHVGNRPGTFDEVAQANILGYLGENRAALSMTQKNIKGETGYRIGLTASVQDSTLSVHFTPLRATIAYLPWSLNADNHVDVDFSKTPLKVNANLQAASNESSVTLLTQPSAEGDEELYLHMKNIHVQDFLSMNVFAPPVKASLSSDLHIKYFGSAFAGKGTVSVKDFIYDRQSVGDFDLQLLAGVDFNGNTDARVSLLVDGAPALTASGKLRADSAGGQMRAEGVNLQLTRFPLKVANAFLGKQTASLSGVLNGNMDMTGSFSDPRLNGYIAFDSTAVFIPMIGSRLAFDTVPITVRDNVVDFDDFDIFGANDNPLTLSGTVDASSFSNILFDLGLKGNSFMVMNNDRRARSDLYGKLVLNIDAGLKGSTRRMDIDGNVSVLSASSVTYAVPADASQITQSNTSDIVRFVQFSDTTQVATADSVTPTMNIRVNANLNIQPGVVVNVLLSSNSTNRIELQPSGGVTYTQNYMGDTRLNGQISLGTGYVRYSVPVIGELYFNLDPGCYVMWNGEMMNPTLNVKAYETIKASVKQAGTDSRLVNFKISVAATGQLESPAVVFDLSTDDDLTVQNELQSMSADQRSQQAINMLLTRTYTGAGVKASGNDTNMVYSFLEGQLNSWAAQNIRGVDLSFGIDQYDNSTADGQNSTTTSYSYQVSKSLFNNRFKIVVGGNYSTDASADENFSQNLISDISFEYMLKQTQTISMYVRLFRHTGYESVLEGEVTETGAGFVMKRRLSNLKELFHFRSRKKNAAEKTDSIPDVVAPAAERRDTTQNSKQD